MHLKEHFISSNTTKVKLYSTSLNRLIFKKIHGLEVANMFHYTVKLICIKTENIITYLSIYLLLILIMKSFKQTVFLSFYQYKPHWRVNYPKMLIGKKNLDWILIAGDAFLNIQIRCTCIVINKLLKTSRTTWLQLGKNIDYK